MKHVYLNEEISCLLRHTLSRTTPYSTSLHEMLAREAARNPEGSTGIEARDLLHQKGYLDPEIIDGTLYLGLPRDVSNVLLEGLLPSSVGAENMPPKDDWPAVFIAVPR